MIGMDGPDDVREPDYDVPSPAIDAAVRVEALDEAGRHLRAIARLEARAAEVAELYAREIRRLMDAQEIAAAQWAARIEWHARPLRELHARLLEDDPTCKTIALPHGTLRSGASRGGQARIVDPEAVAAWAAQSRPELLPPVTKVSVTELRKIVEVHDGRVVDPATGELVPGVEVTEPSIRFTVDTTQTDGGGL